MSTSAVSGMAQLTQQTAKPRPMPTANDATPFGQYLATKTAQAHGHHHHGGASQPAAPATTATSAGPAISAASAAPGTTAAGGSTAGSLAASLLHLLS